MMWKSDREVLCGDAGRRTIDVFRTLSFRAEATDCYSYQAPVWVLSVLNQRLGAPDRGFLHGERG